MMVRVLSVSYRPISFIGVSKDEWCVTCVDPMYQWINGAGYPLTALQLTLVSLPSRRSSGVVILTLSGGPVNWNEIYGYELSLNDSNCHLGKRIMRSQT